MARFMAMSASPAVPSRRRTLGGGLLDIPPPLNMPPWLFMFVDDESRDAVVTDFVAHVVAHVHDPCCRTCMHFGSGPPLLLCSGSPL
jgi:hypothetical protein